MAPDAERVCASIRTHDPAADRTIAHLEGDGLDKPTIRGIRAA
jgi:hypothetical protein